MRENKPQEGKKKKGTKLDSIKNKIKKKPAHHKGLSVKKKQARRGVTQELLTEQGSDIGKANPFEGGSRRCARNFEKTKPLISNRSEASARCGAKEGSISEWGRQRDRVSGLDTQRSINTQHFEGRGGLKIRQTKKEGLSLDLPGVGIP